MNKSYKLVTGGDPCDICKTAEGEYDNRPSVPLHPNCDCSVEETDNGLDDTGDCAFEIRNVQVQTDTSFETTTVQLEVGDPLTEEASGVISVELGVVTESWDDELIKSASGWTAPSGSVDVEVTLPVGTSGTVEIRLLRENTQVMCLGEKWWVCRRAPAPGGLAHALHETLVGNVGGGALAITNVSVDDVNADTEDYDREPFFDSDEEIPA